jgi:protein TonB
LDFARQQKDPIRHFIGIAIVILVHVVVIYGLMTGLAQKAVQVIKKPLTATIVQEIKLPPPPPPPPKKIEIPKVPPPLQQPYVPPPDIPVPTTPSEPIIAAVTPTPPPEPPVIASPAPPAAPAPKPAVRRGIVPISRVSPEYPREAIRRDIASGRVVARLDIDEKGNVTDVRIVEANPPRIFDREVVRALSQWKFQPDGERYVGEIEINFTLKG